MDSAVDSGQCTVQCTPTIITSGQYEHFKSKYRHFCTKRRASLNPYTTRIQKRTNYITFVKFLVCDRLYFLTAPNFPIIPATTQVPFPSPNLSRNPAVHDDVTAQCKLPQRGLQQFALCRRSERCGRGHADQKN